MSRTLPTLAVALLLAAAGCNFASISNSDEGSTGTLTPAPTVSPAHSYPPGLGSGGVTAAFDLADAHGRALRGTSFSVRELRVVRYANGTLLMNGTQRAWIAPDPSRYRFELVTATALPRLSPGNGSVAVYANGTLAAQRTVMRDSEPTYRVPRRPDGAPLAPIEVPHGTPRNVERIGTLLSRANGSVTDEEDRYRLSATGFDGERLDFGSITVENLTVTSFTATVTANGLVRDYWLTVEGTVDGERVTAVERVRYAHVNDTLVAEPNWFDRAVDSSRAS